jgi:hypothetical protein
MCQSIDLSNLDVGVVVRRTMLRQIVQKEIGIVGHVGKPVILNMIVLIKKLLEMTIVGYVRSQDILRRIVLH